MSTPENAIYSGQAEWAKIHGLDWQPSKRGKPYAKRLSANLLEDLPDDVRAQFSARTGSELESKMRALHSSSALAVNVFLPWKILRELDVISGALGMPKGATDLEFEVRFPKPQGLSGMRPNVDVVLRYESQNHSNGDNAGEDDIDVVAIESKFVEPYRDRSKPLKDAYVEAGVWDALPACGEFARGVSEAIARRGFRFLDVAQLLKQALCLHHNHDKRFVLIYLWYEQPSHQAEKHRQEIARFARAMDADGLRFQAMTYQELIRALSAERCSHPGYIEYLRRRYLPIEQMWCQTSNM